MTVPDISTVDNYAYVIIEEPLEYKDIVAATAESLEDLERVLVKVIEDLSN